MHSRTLADFQHSHDYSVNSRSAERRTQIVLGLTAVTMLAEIIAGTVFGSMALLADGWHMGTHVAAFFITLFAYRYARRNALNPAYSFGTGKVNVLAGFASAVVLGVVALFILLESVTRFFEPQAIQFGEAILVAGIGLAVNLLSAVLLKDDHHHHHGHHHGHGHHAHHDHDHDHDHDHHDHEQAEHHHDHNLRAAYLHVLADALTSVLAIAALLAGKYLGWMWLDPVMGVVGSLIIAHWALGLIRTTSPMLLDASIEEPEKMAIREVIESDADNRVADLHVWKVGEKDYAAIISLVTHSPRPAQHYRTMLSGFRQLSHITVEVHACHDEECVMAPVQS